MANQFTIQAPNNFVTRISLQVPLLIDRAGDNTKRRFIEFFTAQIRNKGTREAYLHAVKRFFSWCERHGVQFEKIEPIVIATYIESLTLQLSAPTVKLHLAAIRMLYDYLVIGQIVPFNPAASVRGPKHVAKKGKTPVLSAGEARLLLDGIDLSTIGGLRDRALIGVMVFSFARVSATLGMNVDDFYQQGRRMWLRLHEKGGKYHEVPAHHLVEEYVDAYILAAGLSGQRKSPLFRTIARDKKLSNNRMHRTDALRMVKRRAVKAGLPVSTCCHSWRATGITNYLQNGGSLEHAMQIAAHESARTTKLYDRTSDEVSLDEIERVRI
ncbi:Tyrosine recombinase XerD [Roseimaritima multifibrata]|uniref:Tyrosine recombinase XerD n=1 Tax=Roseimaritima multifibrata TaxID=1930274 RepID=A0A517M971_9BACT|nr:tyrosine-type recombinase/integrase [Roseimaritima multifibrata]QDS91424.1 Tyrosine recombinase XerD [Roseimaritima multifibrata]